MTTVPFIALKDQSLILTPLRAKGPYIFNSADVLIAECANAATALALVTAANAALMS